MFNFIIMDNSTMQFYNYCLCCYSKFICYYLFFKCFGFHMPWQLPFPFPSSPPPPLSLLTAQQELIKIYVLGYEPAGLTVHPPPPKNDRGWFHFFRMGV